MILIAGAGPTGLGAAYHLRSDLEYLVLEKEKDVGGMCRSFELDGAIFDYGGHSLSDRPTDVLQLLWQLSNDQVYIQDRSTWIYAYDTFIRYPFHSNLYGLPTEVINDCLVGLVSAVQNPSSGPPKNLYDWMLQSFGQGIVEHYMKPFNEKSWSFPLGEIFPAWAADRVVQPNAEEIIRGALERRSSTSFPHVKVAYPAFGGFSSFFTGFVPKIKSKLRQGTVAEIDLQQHFIVTDRGEHIHFEKLISTMPLTELVKRTRHMPADCKRAATELHHNSLYLINLVFNRPLSDFQRLHSADPKFPFHKLVFNYNSSEMLRSAASFGVQAEVVFSPHRPIKMEGLVEHVLDSLRYMKMLKPGERPLATSIVTVPLAYPVYTHSWANARELLCSYFRQRDVFCTGRFGEWLYLNADDAVAKGKAIAELINMEL